jgi:thiamine-phosphate pyrophosphorylase
LWLYYITDRKQFSGGPAEQRRRLLEKIAEAASCGVDFIQLREKDLSSRELENLAREAVATVRENSQGGATDDRAQSTRFLINSRVDVAIAVGADGVHLPANDLSPSEARAIWNSSMSLTGPHSQPVVGISCHSAGDIQRARDQGADFAVFAPVFEKVTTSEKHAGVGLAALRAACGAAASASASKRFPVLALGGVTLENARSCVEAGAAGIAGIRLFQFQDVQTVVARLTGHS